MTLRRIDALYCSRETAEERVRSLIAELEERCILAREEVCAAVAVRIQALQERQQELLEKIDIVAQQKVQALDEQLGAIEAGICPPAPVENPEKDCVVDPFKFVLCSDATVEFKVGEEDFLEKINNFGSISESSTYASQSFVRGPALGSLKVGNPAHLWVYSCDRDGSCRAEGGDIVEVIVSTPAAFERIEVQDTKDGKYKVSLLPCQEGMFNLRITVAPPGLPGEDVRDGPFRIAVKPPTEFHRIGAEGQPPKPRMGEASSGLLGTMSHPSGVDFDHTGRYLFVVDQGNHRIQVFDTQHPDGHRAIFAFGKKGLGPFDFDAPCDLVVDQENRVIVSDLLNHRIQVLEFLPRTQSLRHVRSVSHGLNFPKGLGITDHGQLLVCDSGNHCLQVFNVLDDFSYAFTIGLQGTGEGEFNCPLDVAVNRAGEILVADSSSRISVFDKAGQFLYSIGTKGKKDGCFNYPVSITVSDEDVLYVCDQGNRRVQVLSASDGSFLHKWSVTRKKKGIAGDEPDDAVDAADEGAGAKAPLEPELLKPMGIAVNSHGLVVVSDYESNLLWTF